jgi:hypothetical protein
MTYTSKSMAEEFAPRLFDSATLKDRESAFVEWMNIAASELEYGDDIGTEIGEAVIETYDNWRPEDNPARWVIEKAKTLHLLLRELRTVAPGIVDPNQKYAEWRGDSHEVLLNFLGLLMKFAPQSLLADSEDFWTFCPENARADGVHSVAKGRGE